MKTKKETKQPWHQAPETRPGAMKVQEEEMQTVENDVHHLHSRAESNQLHLNPNQKELKSKEQKSKK